jgi:Tellurite resistance protein TerB
MHIIIGLITAIAGLLWALNTLQKSGLDLNALNPFTWHRRRQWQKKVGQKPLYNLQRPLEVAAAVLIGAAMLEGEISREQKKDILAIFENEFNLTSTQATELFSSISYLLKDEDHLIANMDKVFEQSKSQFTDELSTSLVELVNRVCLLDGPMSESQQALVTGVQKIFALESENQSKWS